MFKFQPRLKDELVGSLSMILDNSNYRQTGRSELFAKAYIVIAYRNPQKPIKIFDHTMNSNKNIIYSIIDRIYRLTNNRIISSHLYDPFSSKNNIKHDEIMYIPKHKNEPLCALFKDPNIVKNFNLNEKYNR